EPSSERVRQPRLAVECRTRGTSHSRDRLILRLTFVFYSYTFDSGHPCHAMSFVAKMNAPDQIPLPIESNFMATSLSVPATRKPGASKEKIRANTEKYEPIASIWYGEDAALLERMLDFYPRTQPRRILDTTVN